MAQGSHMLPKRDVVSATVVLKEWVNFVHNGFIKRDAHVIGATTALLVVFITLVLFVFLRRRSNSRRGILLMGICESGKTALFLQLTRGEITQTYTSIKENSGLYRTKKNKSLKLIDLPGHERLRSQFLASNATLARGVVYMVDSVTAQKDVRDVAEYLYTILTDPVISRNAPPFLVACNKQDQSLAKAAAPIKALIEKELNTLRVTKSAALQGTDDSGRVAFLGKRNKDFEFGDVKPIRVDFIECHVTSEGGECDVNLVRNWLDRIA